MTAQQEKSAQLSGPLELVASVVILLSIAGLPLFIVARIIYPSLLPSSVTIRLGIAAAAWVLVVPILWLLTRRPKRGGWFLAMVITAAIGFPMFSYGSLGVANALFDAGPPEERIVQVLRRRKLTGQNNSHPYRLTVRSWLPATQELEVIVEGDLWRTKPQQVVVLEKPGLLGWPWVDEVRAAPSK